MKELLFIALLASASCIPACQEPPTTNVYVGDNQDNDQNDDKNDSQDDNSNRPNY